MAVRQVITFKALSISERLEKASGGLAEGKITHVLGQNGAGKSTLLLALAGLLPQAKGRIEIRGKSLSSWALSTLAGFRSYHAQQHQTPFGFCVEEYLGFYSASLQQARVQEILFTYLDISSLLSRRFNTLSGGEQQRVGIARSLLQTWPALMAGEAIAIFDEPLQGLDIRHQQLFASLCAALANKGNTILMSSHDVGFSANHADVLWLMKAGKLVATGAPKQVINTVNLNDTFDCQFAINNTQNDYQITPVSTTETPRL